MQINIVIQIFHYDINYINLQLRKVLENKYYELCSYLYLDCRPRFSVHVS